VQYYRIWHESNQRQISLDTDQDVGLFGEVVEYLLLTFCSTVVEVRNLSFLSELQKNININNVSKFGCHL